MSNVHAASKTDVNPLLQLFRASADVELQPYDQIEIVSTFGQPQAEYAALRKSCGLIDLPQRGILELTGNERLSFLNNLVSNETWNKSTKRGLESGQGVYAFFLNVRGRIVADMNILERGDRTLIETDVRKVDLLRTTWDRYLFTEQVKMLDRRGSLHEIALHGPTSFDVLKTLSADLEALAPLQSTSMILFGIEVTLWRDDVCGVPGYHLIVPTESVKTLWTGLCPLLPAASTEARAFDAATMSFRMVRPVGWAAFNAARIEAARPMLDIDFVAAAPDRPGAKFDLASSAEIAPSAQSVGVLPAELGSDVFGRAINLSKCYVGQEVVARMHARKQVARMIVGVRMSDAALPVAGAKVLDDAANEIGVVTSSTVSPLLSNMAICLAYVKRGFTEIGATVTIPAEGAMRRGNVVETPFVKL